MAWSAAVVERARTSVGHDACVDAAVNRLPHGPGVYRFRDARGRVLYVGRAVDLRRRVVSYWGDLHGRRHLRSMVARIHRVEAVVCDSEHEASWLERNLLRARRPPWNRSVGEEVPVYVRLDTRPRSPGLTVVHRPAPSITGVEVFGPYLGGTRARLAVAGLERVVPLAYTAQGLSGGQADLARALGVDGLDRADVLDTMRKGAAPGR
jgi:excinuclease ABC subunit C